MLPRLIRLLRRFAHYLVYVAGGAVIVVCIVALTFKFWVMPNISTYTGVLEEAASRTVGQPVTVGKLEAGWSGFNPRVTLRDVRMTPPAGPPLTLPRVEAVFSWLSLPWLELRLASLMLDQPRVLMRRDAAGVITLAGIPLNLPGPPSPFPDWLLQQPRIVIKDAEVLWQDAQLDAPELRFSGVRVLLENRFGRHRFGGIAYPTAAAARRVELRGDLRGSKLQDRQAWSGEIYARVDDARFESWGRWVPWAQQSVRGGVGDMRFWLDLNQGKLHGLSGDVRLAKVAINIDPALPDLLFDSLTGHAGWKREQDEHAFFVDQLRFKTPGAGPSEPAALRVKLTPLAAAGKGAAEQHIGGFKRIAVSARNLRLEALTALTGALPLPQHGHDLIQSLNPRGLVEDGVGHWAGSKDYAMKLRIRDAGVNPYLTFPGINGLTARVDATQAGGEAVIDGRGASLLLPSIFRHELGFSQLDAKADWKFDADGMKLNFAAERIVNPDLDGNLEGHLTFPNSGPIVADVGAHLNRGEANAVYRYLPLKVGDQTYNWLKQSLLSGQSDDVRLVLKGALDRFPFDRGGGEFNVAIKMRDGVLDYAPGWPRIEAVNGMLVFHAMSMTLTADSGRILDTRLGPVKVSIPDLHYTPDEALIIDGQAQGETRAFLDFIKRSPVNEHTARFTEPFKATGEGRLQLHLHIPLRQIEATTLAGSFVINDNQLDPGGDLPVLRNISGSVDFTQATLRAKDVRANLLNLPVTLAIDSVAKPGSDERQVRVHLDGEINAAALKAHLPAALTGRVSGGARWQADVGLKPASTEGGASARDGDAKSGLAISSDLVGLGIDLPAPFGKKAAQPMPLSIAKELVYAEKNNLGDVAEMDAWFARYGDLLTLRARLPGDAPARVHVRFGAGEASAPKNSGLSISGTLRKLDLDAWRQLDLGAGGAAQLLPLRDAGVTFNELKLLNRRLHDTHLKLRPAGAGWRLSLAGREVIGELATVVSDTGTMVLANFKRLSWPEAEPGVTAEVRKTPVDQEKMLGKPLLGIDLSADSVVWQGHELGELHLRMLPDPLGLRMDNFLLANPDGRLRGKGLLANHPRRPTRLEFDLESENLDKLLSRLGMPGSVRRGKLHISGPLGWTGGLEAFDLTKLEGDLEVNAKNGQFLKIEPGAGKLLGILSLQSLPRRIALDFRDVFTDGFAFDDIAGQVHIERGSAYAKNLRMSGPAAKVSMSGVANLVNETQNLRVSIQPRLEDTLAVAGALLGGPAVGVGALIASKVLQNPLGQAAAFEYVITGPWADPLVTKLDRPKVEPASNE